MAECKVGVCIGMKLFIVLCSCREVRKVMFRYVMYVLLL